MWERRRCCLRSASCRAAVVGEREGLARLTVNGTKGEKM